MSARLYGGFLYKFEPVSAFTSSRLATVQPHPVHTGGVLFTDAADNARVERGWDLVGRVLGTGATFDHLQVEGIIVTAGFGQQFTLLQTGGVLQWVSHCCGQ